MKCGWVGWNEKGRKGTTWGKEVDRIIIRNGRLLERFSLGAMGLKIVSVRSRAVGKKPV